MPRHSFRSRTEPSPEGAISREATGGTIRNRIRSEGGEEELIVSLRITTTCVPIRDMRHYYCNLVS
jgi:hypothetical protein